MHNKFFTTARTKKKPLAIFKADIEKALSRWFTKLGNTGAIRLPYHGMKPCLLYADDALFFVKP